MTDYEWLGSFKCNQLYLTLNDEHAPNYVTAKEWIEEFQPKDFTDTPAEELQAMKDTNTIWRLQIYDHTPVGFYVWYGATMQSVVGGARAFFEEGASVGQTMQAKEE